MPRAAFLMGQIRQCKPMQVSVPPPNQINNSSLNFIELTNDQWSAVFIRKYSKRICIIFAYLIRYGIRTHMTDFMS